MIIISLTKQATEFYQSTFSCIQLAAVLTLMCLLPHQCKATEKELNVGVILPLSGKASGVGDAIRNGIAMGLDSIPESARLKLRFHFEDDGSESKNTLSAYKVLQGKIDVVVTALANSGHALAPLTEREGVPHISLSLDRSVSRGTKTTFTFWINADSLADAAAQHALSLGYKRIALVTTQHEGNIAMQEALIKAFSNSVEYPLNEEVQLSDNEFLTTIARLRRVGKLNAIAALMHPGHLGTFAKELRRAGISTPLFTLGGFEDSGVRKSANDSLRGAWYSSTQYRPGFLGDYVARFPSSSPYGAANGHDLVLLFHEAQQSGISKNKLASYFRKARISHGACKEIVADGENSFNMPAEIRVVGEDY